MLKPTIYVLIWHSHASKCLVFSCWFGILDHLQCYARYNNADMSHDMDMHVNWYS
jgi:hypothetical protein